MRVSISASQMPDASKTGNGVPSSTSAVSEAAKGPIRAPRNSLESWFTVQGFNAQQLLD